MTDVLPPRHPRRRHLTLALLALVWLAQQLGLAAHGTMQLRMAAGGATGEVCTSAGLVRAPGDAPEPAGHLPSAASFCDVCAGAALAVLPAPAPVALLAPVRTATAAGPASRSLDTAPSERAHRPRAPPTLLS